LSSINLKKNKVLPYFLKKTVLRIRGMKRFVIKRIASISDGTFGVLVFGGIPFALTLEPPWMGNTPNVSCIPAASYIVRQTSSPRFGETYEITNVPGRSHILFHKGNVEQHTKGCILVGEQFSVISDYNGIAQSGAGFAEFLVKTEMVKEFALDIINYF
tara:strand:+ start:1286 stop:1762 length:477 start_codon:yes stop_codon:yes gene_type:complete